MVGHLPVISPGALAHSRATLAAPLCTGAPCACLMRACVPHWAYAPCPCLAAAAIPPLMRPVPLMRRPPSGHLVDGILPAGLPARQENEGGGGDFNIFLEICHFYYKEMGRLQFMSYYGIPCYF